MGRPATFIRLSGCTAPLCPWCDTMYACGAGEDVTIDQIVCRVRELCHTLVVITGGEPYLQWDSGVNQLESTLLDHGFSIQYETGGKILIPEDSRGFKVCSPKFFDGQWHFVLDNIALADCFKFVVKDEVEKVQAFVETHKISREKVWMMPLGATRKEQLQRSPGVWEFCVKNGFNFSPRLHTLTFNNKRGV